MACFSLAFNSRGILQVILRLNEMHLCFWKTLILFWDAKYRFTILLDSRLQACCWLPELDVFCQPEMYCVIKLPVICCSALNSHPHEFSSSREVSPYFGLLKMNLIAVLGEQVCSKKPNLFLKNQIGLFANSGIAKFCPFFFFFFTSSVRRVKGCLIQFSICAHRLSSSFCLLFLVFLPGELVFCGHW